MVVAKDDPVNFAASPAHKVRLGFGLGQFRQEFRRGWQDAGLDDIDVGCPFHGRGHTLRDKTDGGKRFSDRV